MGLHRWNSSTHPATFGRASAAAGPGQLHQQVAGYPHQRPPSPQGRMRTPITSDLRRTCTPPWPSPPSPTAPPPSARQRPGSAAARRQLDMEAITRQGLLARPGSKRQASPVQGRASLVGPRPTRPITAPIGSPPAEHAAGAMLAQGSTAIAQQSRSGAISPRDSAHSFNSASTANKAGQALPGKHARGGCMPKGPARHASPAPSRACSADSSTAAAIAQPGAVRQYLAGMLNAPLPSALSPAKRALLANQQQEQQRSEPASPSGRWAAARQSAESSVASLAARSDLSSHGTPNRGCEPALRSAAAVASTAALGQLARAGSANVQQQEGATAAMDERWAGSACSAAAADAVSALPGYSLGGAVGEGGFCQVRAGQHALSGQAVAVKVIDRSKLKEPIDQRRIGREVSILSRLSHASIIRLLEVVEAPAHLYLVMELAQGGSLLDYVRARKRLSEAEACSFLQQIVGALMHCHQHEVIHRDVKLENILLDAHNHIKLIDFGLAAEAAPGKRLKVHCGSPSYAAPEIVGRKQYDGPPVDVWSLGVVLYAMICGHLPFHAHSGKKELCQKIMKGVFSVPAFMSPPARDLLLRMLTVVPEQRISFEQVLRHAWVLQGPRWQGVAKPCPYQLRVDPGTGALLADEQVLQQLEGQGLARAIVLHHLVHGHCNSVTAAYHLLQQAARQRQLAQAHSPVPHSGGRSSMLTRFRAQQLQQQQQAAAVQRDAGRQDDSAHTLHQQPFAVACQHMQT